MSQWKTGAGGFCYRASESCSYLALPWASKVFGEFKLQKNWNQCSLKNFYSLVEMTFGEVHASYSMPTRLCSRLQHARMASCKTDFLCTLMGGQGDETYLFRISLLLRQENKMQSCKLSREMSKWNLPNVQQNPTCGHTQWPDRSNLKEYHSTVSSSIFAHISMLTKTVSSLNSWKH